ncbi:MAG: T9SS type A sorting domain-containing protein [Bacteroidota bacterium]
MKKQFLFIIMLAISGLSVNAQWTAVNMGLPISGTSEYEWFASIGSNLFVGTGTGVYVTSDNGASWTAASNGLTNTDIEALASIGPNLFAATGNGIFKSVDNGANWIAMCTGLNTANGTSVYSLFASGTNLFSGTEAGVFVTAPPYTSWTAVNTGLMLVDFYAFTQIGSYIFSGGLGVYRTSNNGGSWTQMTSGLPDILNSDFESFAVLGSNVYAGDLGLGVFKSTDNGTNWAAMTSGLTDLHIQALAANGNSLFAGGINGGVFLSNDNGASWTAVNTGLTNLEVLSFQVFGSYLYAGTGGGVFRAPLSSFAGISELQNNHVNVFPVPCHETLRIMGDAPATKHVEIYNTLGKCVQQNELNTNEVDVSALVRGIYMLRLSGKGWTEQRKFIKE